MKNSIKYIASLFLAAAVFVWAGMSPSSAEEGNKISRFCKTVEKNLKVLSSNSSFYGQLLSFYTTYCSDAVIRFRHDRNHTIQYDGLNDRSFQFDGLFVPGGQLTEEYLNKLSGDYREK